MVQAGGWMGVREAATALGFSTQWVGELIRSGKLSAVKTSVAQPQAYLIPRREVQAMLDARRTAGPGAALSVTVEDNDGGPTEEAE